VLGINEGVSKYSGLRVILRQAQDSPEPGWRTLKGRFFISSNSSQ